ncbi:MAG: helix-turn-helix domain-containing protein [Planctomycetota bacterium]|nr:helix-turn-helix domain-containing protein [Planctomycetota bacterium]
MGGNSLQPSLKATTQLRKLLMQLLNALDIHEPRMSDLRQFLGLDKSTASRIARGLLADGPAAALKEFPAATGLRLFVDSCEQRKAPQKLLKAARAAIDRVEQCVHKFPGGRSGLATALAATASDRTPTRRLLHAKASAERSARRAAFNAASYLQGLWVEAAVHGMFIGPSGTHRKHDQALLHAAVGMKRLRPGPPITIGGFYGSPLTAGAPTRLTLAGAPIEDDASVVLMPAFCDGPVDRLHAEQRDRAFLLWLDREDPPLDRPATLVYGVKYPEFIDGVKNLKFHYTCTNFTVRRPTKLFVLELMVCEGAFKGHDPMLRLSTDPQRVPDPINGPPADDRECLEHTSAFIPMGRGFTSPGTARADAFVPIFADAMKRLKWNPAEFRRYRLEIEYPLNFIGMQVWFKLPDAVAKG